MMTLVIFGVLILFMSLGVPIAIAMGVTAIITFVFLGEGSILAMMAQRMYSATTGFTLLAIPFFIMAGNLMNTGGITNRIFRFARAIMGHVPGGLGQVNIVASMIFSGMSGAAVADAAGLGQVELKAMNDAGYDRKFSAAITAASSTIGPVVPPSIPFVIYGSITGVSVGKLFLAGFTPGILMGIAMMIAVVIVSYRRGYPREKFASFPEIWASFKGSLLPLGTPVIIIGGILGGLFTPTEAAVVACVYALILGLFIYREITFADLPRIFWETILHSVRVMFIIASAGFFGWLLIHQRIPRMVIESLTSISGDPNVIMVDHHLRAHPARLLHRGCRGAGHHHPGLHADRRALRNRPGPVRRGHDALLDDRTGDAAGGDEPLRGFEHQRSADRRPVGGAPALHRGDFPGAPGGGVRSAGVALAASADRMRRHMDGKNWLNSSGCITVGSERNT